MFFGLSTAFYEHLFTCDISSIITENTPCIQRSHCAKCLDIARRKHYQAKYMHPFFGCKGARPTNEFSALGALDVGIVAEGCWNFHCTTKWNVTHEEQSMLCRGQLLRLLQQPLRGTVSGLHSCPRPMQ